MCSLSAREAYVTLGMNHCSVCMRESYVHDLNMRNARNVYWDMLLCEIRIEQTLDQILDIETCTLFKDMFVARGYNLQALPRIVLRTLVLGWYFP